MNWHFETLRVSLIQKLLQKHRSVVTELSIIVTGEAWTFPMDKLPLSYPLVHKTLG